MTSALAAFLAGLALSFSLILAIGAQNAFVLRQGLRREHVGAVVLVCCVSEAILIAAGVAGFGALAGAVPWALDVMRWGGVAFLVLYGARALRAAVTQTEALEASDGARQGLGAAVSTALVMTWANPHVYLDTVGLIGAVAAQYRPAHWAFGAGALTASVVFFVALGYGARALAPVFARPAAWRVLDGIVGLTMLALAAKLALGG
jgi:L-lysine exporter family protein LysE/ArgO